jgi:uncharacterized protein YggT (Ycf19 family)
MTAGLARRTLPSMTTEHPTSAPIVAAAPRSTVDIGKAPAASSGSSIWTATRVIALVLTVLETLLLARFALLLFGANASQPLVSFVYGITDPLVRPFQGIFGQPAGPPTLDIAAVLAIMFFLLLGALVVAGVRAVTGRQAGPRPIG